MKEVSRKYPPYWIVGTVMRMMPHIILASRVIDFSFLLAKWRSGLIATNCRSRLKIGFRFDLHLCENRLANYAGERGDQNPVGAKLPQCRTTEALNPRLRRKHRTLRRLRSEPEIPRYLCVSGAREPAKITRSKVEAPA